MPRRRGGRRIGFESGSVRDPADDLLLAAIWLLLAGLMRRAGVSVDASAAETVYEERRALGRMSSPERRVLVVFVLVAIVWVVRPFLLEPFVPGLTDSMIAVAGAMVLFVLPEDLRAGRFLLHWSDTKNVNYGILLLMGGGLSLAAAFQAAGLGEWIASRMGGLSDLSQPLVVLIVAVVVIVLTNIASNTAIATLLIPIVISLGDVLGSSPLALMATVAVSASAAFVLPVATPPNAVVFASGNVTVGQMARAGLVLSVVATLLVTAISLYWLPLVLK